jgi:glycosyltransferase involved in cell wall biosynthesis
MSRREDLVPGLTVVLSAHNEELVLDGALKSVAGLAREVILVDSGSSDRTEEIALDNGARVLTEPNRLMLNTNKNIGLKQASSEWTLMLDPDERVSPVLRSSIQGVVSSVGGPNAYRMRRRNYELGVVLTTMGHYPDLQLRLFRTGTATFPCRHIHESVAIDGVAGDLDGDLFHYPKQTVSQSVSKRNLYSDHRALALYREGRRFQVRRLIARPAWSFTRNYVLRKGWREGVPGLIVAVTGAFGTFLQDAKLWQLQAFDGQDPRLVLLDEDRRGRDDASITSTGGSTPPAAGPAA